MAATGFGRRAHIVAGGAVALFWLVASTGPDGISARAQPSPRLTGQAAASDTEVIVNQVDASRFPKITVFATVLRGGQPVKGLGAADFRVREDEVDQSPVMVEPRLEPLFAVLTLDTSGSMRQRLPEAKAAARLFIDSLTTEDRVRALSFARDVRTLNGPGADRDAAKAGIDAAVARGDTALYDALYTSVELTREQPGRKAVVLLSDGVDDDGTGRQLSKRSLGEALDLARLVNVPVYAIGLGTDIDDGILRRIAAETGGQYYKAPEAGELRALKPTTLRRDPLPPGLCSDRPSCRRTGAWRGATHSMAQS
jgi:Mg-chelatase subunit ChlD